MPQDELEVRAANMLKALVEIVPWRKANKGKSASTTIVCPKCGGPLDVFLYPGKGHTRGWCATKGCISWIE